MHSYRILGPTTIHLQLELYNWIALLLLSVSSLRGLHQDDSRGLSQGDITFILLMGLWLGRNLFVRWVCTSEHSTHRSPTLTGVVAHWLTSHFLAGQYFDRPNIQAVAKQLGTHHTEEGRNNVATLSSFLLPSVLFTWQLCKIWIVFPLLSAKEFLFQTVFHSSNSNNSQRAASRQMNAYGGSKRGKDRLPAANLRINTFYAYWSKFWNRHGPPLQMIIPLSTFLLYIYGLLFADNSSTEDEGTHALTMNMRATQSNHQNDEADPLDDILAYGGYQTLEKPSWKQVLFLMSISGTLMTILIFGRVIVPITDLVAGGNVLRAVRNESKTHHGSHSSTGKPKSKLQRDNLDVPWAEQYRSIVGENRFRLISKSSCIRFAENLLLCALFPRTGFACRFTGHCPEGASLLDLNKVFFPMGIVSALRPDGNYESQFALITIDRGAAVLTILSVILITGSTILTQAATLDRSYLAIMGHLAGGWTIVSESHPAVAGRPKPSPWDPRRRYNKGDLISQPFPGIGTQTIYMATTNQPEGKPYDLGLRAAHDMFRNELGHPANSALVKFLATMHLNLIVALMMMIFAYHALDYDCGSLRWTLAANLLSAYATLSARSTDLTAMERLACEVSGCVKC